MPSLHHSSDQPPPPCQIPRLSPCVLWLPLFKMTPRLPHMLRFHSPLPKYMLFWGASGLLRNAKNWTLAPCYGHCTINRGKRHAQSLRGLPPCPLDISASSLPASLIQCLRLPPSRTSSWAQLCALLCFLKGGGTEELHRSRSGPGKAGGTAFRHCQGPSESETPPRTWTRQWSEHGGWGMGRRLSAERKGCARGGAKDSFQLQQHKRVCCWRMQWILIFYHSLYYCTWMIGSLECSRWGREATSELGSILTPPPSSPVTSDLCANPADILALIFIDVHQPLTHLHSWSLLSL